MGEEQMVILVLLARWISPVWISTSLQAMQIRQMSRLQQWHYLLDEIFTALISNVKRALRCGKMAQPEFSFHFATGREALRRCLQFIKQTPKQTSPKLDNLTFDRQQSPYSASVARDTLLETHRENDQLPTTIMKVADPLFGSGVMMVAVPARPCRWGAGEKTQTKDIKWVDTLSFLVICLLWSPLTCVCNVGQVIVLGGARKLLQFAVGEDKRSAGRSLLQRFLHAPAGRYGRRQLGSIPSSHQTLNVTKILLFVTTIARTRSPSPSRQLR